MDTRMKYGLAIGILAVILIAWTVAGCNMVAGAGVGAYKDLKDGLAYGDEAIKSVNE